MDFPQPEGPMIAVTAFCGNVAETFLIAGVSPKYAVRSRVTTHGLARSTAGRGSGTLSAGAATLTGVSRTWRTTSVDCSTEPGARHEARRNTDYENESYQYQRARPRQPVPFFVGTDRVDVDLKRESRDCLPK